jgi:hypothetical protein
MDNWIKSTERLPEVNQRCIVVWDDQIVPHTATLLRDEFRVDGFKWLASNGRVSRDNPLYWMPCPAMPPKEKNT